MQQHHSSQSPNHAFHCSPLPLPALLGNSNSAQRCWHSELEGSLALWQAAHLLAWDVGPGMAGIPCCLTPLQQLGFCTSAQLRHDLQQGNSLSALSAPHQKTGTAAALPVLEHSQERLMPSSVPACLSSEGNNSTGGCQGKESRFCATVLRREAIVATEHTMACAVPDGELRAAAKPGADGRNHELLP